MDLQPWEESLDIDDGLLTPIQILSAQPFSLRRCSNKRSPPHCPIPGPAGTVQSAIVKRRCDRESMDAGRESQSFVSTQECIRRAVEGTDKGDDDDFRRHPWLSAVHFVHSQGLTNVTGEIGFPVTDIKSGVDRVAQVVAIITSCNPNGLGDMLVTIKDPTGIIKASIHRSVFSDEEFKKNVTLGSVLVLHEVAVFSAAPAVQYLNITHRNVVKVFCKNDVQIDDALIPNEAAHSNAAEAQPEALNASSSQKRSASIIQSLRGRSITKQASEPLSRLDEDAAVSELGGEEISGTGVVDGKLPRRTNVEEERPTFAKKMGSVSAPALATSSQPSSSKNSLAQWTDEQLDVLFAFD